MMPQGYRRGCDIDGRRQLLVVVVVTAYVASCPLGTAAQALGSLLTTSTLILTSSGLASTLAKPNIANILINGELRLDEADFRPTPILTRDLTIRGIDGGPRQPNLMFESAKGVLLVAKNGTLRFQNISLSDVANQQTGDPTGVNTIASLSLWPSISGAPGASFLFEGTTTYFTVPSKLLNCTGYQAKTAVQLKLLLGASNVLQPDAVTIHVSGNQTIQLPVTNNGTRIGFAKYASENSTITCVADGGVRRFPWWAGLLLGLAVAAVCGAALVVVAVYNVRKKRQQLAKKIAADVESAAKVSLMATPTSALGGWTPPASKHPSLRSDTISGTVDLAESSKGGSAATSVHGGTLENMHAQLLGMRLQHGLEGVEVGPLLGRGSYGSVFKGRWRGTLVAIKVLEAGLSEAGDNGSRESLLSASIAHPNVVACFKICLVRAREATTSLSVIHADSSPSLTEADIVSARSAIGSRTSSLPMALPAEDAGSGYAVRPMARTGSGKLPAPGSQPSASRSTDEHGVPTGIVLEVLNSDCEETSTHKLGQIQTWMLLEYCDRGSLDRAIQMRRFYRRPTQTLDLVSIYRTLVDIAAGVDHLHGLGIVHADLKPANVLLKSTATDARGFICKLADFGLSRMVSDHCTHVSAATTGTISYMPPEMLRHQRMTKSTDVYSFGIIMNQLFTGEVPFVNMTMPSVLMGVVNEGQRPDTGTDQPPEFAALRDRCWDSDPNNRPSFQVIMEELLSQIKALPAPKPAQAAVKAHLPAASPVQHKHEHHLSQQPATSDTSLPQAIKAVADAGAPAPHAFGEHLFRRKSTEGTEPKSARPAPSKPRSSSFGSARSCKQFSLSVLADSAASQPATDSVADNSFADAQSPREPPSRRAAASEGKAEVLDGAHRSTNIDSDLSSGSGLSPRSSTSSTGAANNSLPLHSGFALAASRVPGDHQLSCFGLATATEQAANAPPLSDVPGEGRERSSSDASSLSASSVTQRVSALKRSSSLSRTHAQLPVASVALVRRTSDPCSSRSSSGGLDRVAALSNLRPLQSKTHGATPKKSSSMSGDKFRPLMQKGTSQHGTIKYTLDLGSRPSGTRSSSMHTGNRRNAQFLPGLREQLVPHGSSPQANPSSILRMGASPFSSRGPSPLQLSDEPSHLAAVSGESFSSSAPPPSTEPKLSNEDEAPK